MAKSSGPNIIEQHVEKAVLGWKETELEVLSSSHAEAAVVACAESIESTGHFLASRCLYAPYCLG